VILTIILWLMSFLPFFDVEFNTAWWIVLIVMIVHIIVTEMAFAALRNLIVNIPLMIIVALVVHFGVMWGASHILSSFGIYFDFFPVGLVAAIVISIVTFLQSLARMKEHATSST